uniref:Uncharacterized protein n=1 Tax=Aegilops tauschii subsp. strangulata TaxID=200361 RepID=A0A452XSV5_AEGTS
QQRTSRGSNLRRPRDTPPRWPPDRLQWKWNASGTYTAQSSYLATFHGSTSCPAWKLTWKGW